MYAFNQALRDNGVNKTLASAQDVWNLTPEEMKILQDFSPKAWAAFFNKGSKGEANIRLSTETLSNNISEMRDIQFQGLHQLEAINQNTYNLFQIKDDIYELKKIAKDRW